VRGNRGEVRKIRVARLRVASWQCSTTHLEHAPLQENPASSAAPFPTGSAAMPENPRRAGAASVLLTVPPLPPTDDDE